jgi:hypothetical protein
MALLFDNAGEDINFGKAANLSDLDPLTVIAWVYPDAITTNYTSIITKTSGPPGNPGWSLTLSDVWDSSIPQSVWFNYRDGSGNYDSAWAVTNTAVIGEWNYIAATWAGPGNVPKIYKGSLNSLATLRSTTDTVSTHDGTTGDVAYDMICSPSAEDTKVAVLGVFEEELSLSQIQSFQFQPRILSSNCKLFAFPGLHGASTVPDLSGTGNNGTITNATVSDHVPLPPPFGYNVVSHAAAGGISIPIAMQQMNQFNGGSNG